MENGPVEIVDFPIKKMVDLSSSQNVSSPEGMVQLCSTGSPKKKSRFGARKMAEASMHAQVRKLGIWQIPEAGNIRYHWYEDDMKMIWIHERTRGLGSITGSLCFFLTVHVVLCVWWCTAKDIEIIEINESENFVMFGPNCSASRA